LNKQILADETIVASTHKYGSQTSQKTHPSLDGAKWISHSHDTHKEPLDHVAPTYRPAEVSCVNPKALTKKSGYQTNSVVFDGKGFLPKEVCADPRKQTEYRVRFNGEKPIHMNTTTYAPRKLNPFTNTFNI